VEYNTPGAYFANDLWVFPYANRNASELFWYWISGYNSTSSANSNPPVFSSATTINNPAGRYIRKNRKGRQRRERKKEERKEKKKKEKKRKRKRKRKEKEKEKEKEKNKKKKNKNKDLSHSSFRGHFSVAVDGTTVYFYGGQGTPEAEFSDMSCMCILINIYI
jgi:lipopolysaccharide export LptBFGC system permease protein LptF